MLLCLNLFFNQNLKVLIGSIDFRNLIYLTHLNKINDFQLILFFNKILNKNQLN